jgi:bifunctional non-homologous end joining protein LigD
VALAFRDELAAIGLSSLVKTSGGSGLHVVVPLKPAYGYDAARQFAEIAARHIGAMLPKLTTLERTIARRPATAVYLDYGQVGRGKTVVPPYVVRARDKAPVSMPLDWSEIEEMGTKRGNPESFIARRTIANARKRLQSEGDLWAGRAWREGNLEVAIRKAQRTWTAAV